MVPESDETTSDPPELAAAINAYPQTPGQSIEQLKPFADADNPRALVALTTFMMLQDQHEQALPYVQKAIQQGIGAIAQLYANDFFGRRPELRAMTVPWVGVALDSGWSVDFRTAATNAVQQDSPDMFSRLVDVVLTARPIAPRARWDELVTKASAEGQLVADAAAEVSGQKEKAFQEIASDLEAVKERRSDADRQANELGVVTSAIAANNLAQDYAENAEKTEGQARRFTTASLIIGAVSVGISAYGLISVKAGSSFDTVLARAAFGLPVALLAAYVNNLATTHRREAWRLRHIELQIRTANPFLGLLDAERRRETLAALALRFFPGQEAISDSKDGESAPLDLIEALGKLLREQQARGVVPSED